MAPWASYVTVFLLTLLGTATAAALTWELLEKVLEKHPAAGSPRVSPNKPPGLLRKEVLGTLALLDPLRDRTRLLQKLKALLAEADLNWPVHGTVLGVFTAGLATMVVLLFVDWVPVLGACFLAGLVAFSPFAYARARRATRVRLVEDQLPEALDYLSRLLVSGHSLPLAISVLAGEVGPPLGPELHKTVDEYNLGRSMPEALRNLTTRLPGVDIQFFVSAIRTQSRTGGGLHDLLLRHAETIRERGVLKGQVRALTAHGRMTAITLSLLPFLVVGGTMLLNPSYMMLLIEDSLGKTLLFMAACSQILAYLVIRRIVDIKV